MNEETIKNIALRTLQIQASAIGDLQGFIDHSFLKAIHIISTSNGRLVITGIGKSAIIAQKITATLNSTGTPALFMHAADAIHGDLGMIQKQDVVMVISKSGDSPEIKVLMPLLKGFGNIIIGLGGNLQSFLANNSDVFINTTVQQEACPNNLAPTSSTTAQMVMGDALAVCLMELKGFGTNDFARFHPGGALGKKLYLRVSDLLSKNSLPSVSPDDTIKEVIVEITKNRLGAAAVINVSNEILGIITDGDLRRMLENKTDISNLTAKDIMAVSPKKISGDALAAEALELMRNYNVNQLLVAYDKSYVGIIHIQDIIREGII